MTNIVTVNVSRTIAPAPSTLQRTGALISQGGTNLAPGTKSLLTSLPDLTPLLVAASALTSLAWAGSVVTATASAPHGITIGDSIPVTITGAVPAAYNGTFLATATTTTAFTYPLVSNPGTETVPGTYRLGAANELLSMATEFFSQGSSVSVWVLELGVGTGVDGIADLQTWITANPNVFYQYLLPREFDSGAGAHAALVPFVRLYEGNTAKTYFSITSTVALSPDFVGIKSAVVTVESVDPVPPAIEFSAAALFWRMLSYNPSNTNKVPPTAFSFLIAVTAGDWSGAQQSIFKTNFVNYVGTGAEGGIANTIALWGTTADGRDFSYWYSVDWVQINLQLDIANEIINGSNNPINPLYYDQFGINRLQARAQRTMDRGVTFGLVNASVPPVVDAVPFLVYTNDNPSDYPIGKYAGLSTSYVPARGFTEIIFNVNVTDFTQS